MSSKKFQASMTIETSLLMPIIIGIVLVILYMSIYQYNLVILDQSTYLSSMRVASIEDNQKRMVIINDMKKEYFENRLLMVKDCRINHKISFDTITINSEFGFNIPFPGFLEAFSINHQWLGKSNKTGKRHRPTEFIRTCRKIQKLSG